MNNIINFLDKNLKVKTWPAKKDLKIEILRYIATKFESGRFYTEKEVNEIIEEWHTFRDYFLIRRGLIDSWFLTRTNNGARYWREETKDFGDINNLVAASYDIGSIKSILRLNGGYGSDSYYILSEKGEFIFKDIEENGMNHPENEAFILDELKNAGLPVGKIHTIASGDALLKTQGRTCHLQSFIDGKTYRRNSAPEWLLYESARMLGRIQREMEKIPPLPIGIGQGFFDCQTPERVIDNYALTLNHASDNGDEDIIKGINSKIRMLKFFENFKFDVSKMTCKNTHGDYKIQNIISGRDRINAVIDFTSACIHPVCWELVRGYMSADKECIEGSVNIENFKRYISCYLEYVSLNSYDLKIMPYIYYYQNLVSDYFNQYYSSQSKNKKELLDSALFSVKQCEWFEENITRLEDELMKGF